MVWTAWKVGEPQTKMASLTHTLPFSVSPVTNSTGMHWLSPLGPSVLAALDGLVLDAQYRYQVGGELSPYACCTTTGSTWS